METVVRPHCDPGQEHGLILKKNFLEKVASANISLEDVLLWRREAWLKVLVFMCPSTQAKKCAVLKN